MLSSSLSASASHATGVSPTHIGILYLGGTIGCAGEPLSPLPADIFLPHLSTILSAHLPLSPSPWHFFSGQIKDSSDLIPEDWADILSLLLDTQHTHIRHWIILHGTDTLAFTAAFLMEALRGHDLKVVVTGSQFPLLHPTQLTLDEYSDALDNLSAAYRALITPTQSDEGNIYVAFNQQYWAADSVQKIHTRERTAFTGQATLHDSPSDHALTIMTHSRLEQIRQHLTTLNIQLYYATPLPKDVLISQLEQLLNSDTHAVIILAYGLGNFPDDWRIQHALLRAQHRGILVILSSQVPFGGVEARYAAGSWLSQCGVLSGGKLPLPAIFARLAWLHVTLKTAAERRHAWLDYKTEEAAAYTI